MQSNENFIKIKAELSFVLFPKEPKIKTSRTLTLGTENNSFGITKWEVTDIIEGDPHTDKEYNIIIKGNFPEPIQYRKEYTLLAKGIENPKYGMEYELIYLNPELDLSKITNQKLILKNILTEKQIEELYNTYDDPLSIINNGDIEKLVQVKGIKEKLASKIIERFEANRDNSEIYVELDGYGLTSNFIQKLLKAYTSPKAVIRIVKEHPYQLIDKIEGVSFKRADEIALRGGLNPKSVERISAFIKWFLEKQANEEGNSYITAGELRENIYNYLDGKDNIEEVLADGTTNIAKAIQYLQDNGELIIEDSENKYNRRVYLTKIWNLENEIAYHLKRLLGAKNKFSYTDWQQKIKELELKQGFDFDEAQINGIKLGLDNQVCLITGGAGCVDADTEFFNGKSWKKISEYQVGDKVLQWNINNTAELVEPIHYIKQTNINGFNVVHNKNNSVFQKLSDNHLVSYTNTWTPQDVKLIKCKDLVQKHNSSTHGFFGRMRTNFMYDGPGINYSDEEIQLLVAIFADGWFDSRRPNINTCRISIKKERKIKRLKELLKLNNLAYYEKICTGAEEGYHKFYFKAPIREKHFPSEWYNCSLHQKEIIFQEILEWDGSDRKRSKVLQNSFSTKNKQDADFIQFVCVSIGYSANIYYYKRRKEYSVNIANRQHKLLSLRAKHPIQKQQIQKIQSLDGYEYCFEVPSGYLILRCEGHVFVTHNCGKSSLVSGILAALYGYSFAQIALSGKGAARLQEVTGQAGSTIHRLLGYGKGENGGFLYNEHNHLGQDIIILDEISMVGGDIFLSLLKAIPTGSKLIMLGDSHQLESISSLNLAHDMIQSPVIPSVELTTIHRQAAKSGIISSSQEVRNQYQLYPPDFEGIDIRGELQDMTFDISVDNTYIRESCMEWFKKWYDSELVKQDIMNIEILVPVKTRGDTSVFNLNNDIQSIINPLSPGEPYVKIKEKSKNGELFYYLHINDKIMCIKNNYNAVNLAGDKVPIFNGWTGIVQAIRENGDVLIDFPLAEDKVILTAPEVREDLILGYASTIHKFQGSDVPVIIGALDYNTPPSMLTCQLVYTLLTRAKKHCVLVAQNGALGKAIATNNVIIKRTFLQEMLVK